MKELFYIGETSTSKKVLVHKGDYDELGNKAAESLKDMGITVDTNKTVLKEVQEEPEFGSKEYFDAHDCWDAVGGDWEG